VRWLADECVDAGLVGRLRGAGHDALYTAEIASGATDPQVIRRAHEDGRVLLTEDKDFGDLVFRLGMAVPGLVLLRVSPEKHLLKWRRLEAAIAQFGDRLIGRYILIEEGRFDRGRCSGQDVDCHDNSKR
jgi:predicted nuclease of predicted toxin-antitoxin system